MGSRYCVVIPAFNANGRIGELVRRVRRHGFEVIVIDDGSRDGTASIASREGALVISHLRNEGKGRALRTAFEYALRSRYDGVVTMDSDGQHDPDEILKLVRAGERQHAGIVVGNRLTDGSLMPLARHWTNALMSSVVSAVARQRIPDSQCGFRFIRAEVLADVPLRSRHFEIESELLFGAAARRWKIVSVPVRSIYQGERSHIRPVRDGMRFIRTLLRHLMGRG
ncbi:MAG: glycosyltransferase family 2 protein [Candidatus Omnitrophica bacterium]|nr:glycosyltransferase family 2 protein [Candidatus Omnitrophota bacterium]MBI3083378.1 glycosyltransferase family 2 protein [Candidatus Omnitrophota bacterium]